MIANKKQETTLEYFLSTHFHVGVSTTRETILASLNNPSFPHRAEEFKRQLTDAILNSSISPNKLEMLTDSDFETQEEADDFLRNYVWKTIYVEPAPSNKNLTVN